MSDDDPLPSVTGLEVVSKPYREHTDARVELSNSAALVGRYYHGAESVSWGWEAAGSDTMDFHHRFDLEEGQDGERAAREEAERLREMYESCSSLEVLRSKLGPTCAGAITDTWDDEEAGR